MADSVAALVLAAGLGTRLEPLTRLRPKPLCPVGGVPLVDHALARVEALVGAGPEHVAVNAHHHAEQVVAHLEGRAHVSVEPGAEALGTAGAVGHLGGWLAGRALVVVNGDTWSRIPLDPLLEGWDGERVRVLVLGPPGSEAAPGVPVVASVLPAAVAAGLPAEVGGLTNLVWWPARERGELESVAAEGEQVACDRPRDYLAANLAESGGTSVIGEGAVVEGEVIRSVVWPGQHVRAGVRLIDAVQAADDVVVLVR
jgi:N-acetyl-alpha-D-muramate 1-phosphate uridylyltransferase